ncbi:hypothetical protein [Pontibacillus litoralis]|uniref:SCP2 domain-containing protein n=1 Tax=Pontibacillus litoralis JSM 072002 TaxID=1385512 RepID=A0A0A5G3S6_9BACI|nr:hypothetical protein [Pontibacillus litoralis]KGX85793.1 hypothetical protein N784_08040 [Pontibacillus litoralis JSM 072002]
MNLQSLFCWKDRLEQRKDLVPLLSGKSIVIHFRHQEGVAFVHIDQGKCHINTEQYQTVHVTIEAEPSLLEELWDGNHLLLAFPDSVIRRQGRYKDLLFVEAVFRLAA